MGKIIVKHVSTVDPTIFKCRESRRIITPETEDSQRMSLHIINRYQRGVSYLVKYPENDEILYILEGEGYIIDGDKKIKFKPGYCVFIPQGTGYKIYNRTDLKMVAVLSPARFREDWKDREDLVMLEEEASEGVYEPVGKLVRIDMRDKKVTYEDMPRKYKDKRGRWLTSSIVATEVDPTCHPLGPNNKLVIAPGMVTGTTAPCSGRLSVGAKSPLTGGIKESNAGTPFSQKLAKLGITALVIEGQAEDGPYMLKVDREGAKLIPVEKLKNIATSKLNEIIFNQFGKQVAVMAIGPAGEMKMNMSGICFSDPEGRASRYAGRGGLGAVMGSKGLKAITVDDSGDSLIELKNKEKFSEGKKKLADALRTHDVTKPGGGLNSFGTAVLVNTINESGSLPTKNFRYGQFEGASKISGEAIAETINRRKGGIVGHGCHPGCMIKCSNVYPLEDKEIEVSAIEFESVWSFGANCCIDDLDVIAELIHMSNEYGVDTIEAGVAIGVAMEAGLIEFGDKNGALKLMKEIGIGTPLGRVLGGGADMTGRILGTNRVPTVKGQSMSAYDPRAIKGMGVTYCTSPMGADHTSGYTVGPEILGVGGQVDPFSTEGKVELSMNFQAATAFFDSSGYCLFTSFAVLDNPSGMEGIVDSVNGVLGTNWTTDDIGRIGLDILNIEHGFNEKAGLRSKDDRLPEFMRHEVLPPHNQVFNISDEEIDKFWK